MNVPVVAPGSYYMIVYADYYGDALFESDQANNTRAFPVTVVAPDLQPTSLTITSGSFVSNASLVVSYSIRNAGDGPVTTGPAWWDGIYLSGRNHQPLGYPK